MRAHSRSRKIRNVFSRGSQEEEPLVARMRVFCHKCGAILYEGVEIKALYDIISIYDGKCPKCGRKLSFIPKTVQVKAAYDVDKGSRLGKRKRK